MNNKIMNCDRDELYVSHGDKKVVFLTFDDGPGHSSSKRILSVLQQKNVKASFFIVGENIRNDTVEVVEGLYENGMDIYPHCYDHHYETLYKSEDSYFNDFNKYVNSTKGLIYRNKRIFVRMPGGSLNTYCRPDILKNIKNRLEKSDIDYIDWNVSIGDAVGSNISKEQLIGNVKKQGDVYRVAVVLMHDADHKSSTIDALPEIIDFYKEKGYRFKSLSEMTTQEYEYLKKVRVINKK
ncbi:polysaccharide deacetylase [Clostridium folliculivorans]|uniref:Polysaccharide deacetylase n=1 Tax=Clostridium folliculivorans TaxID=2886038 RepID=A0A9W5Y2P0_9CLOT|nr:polysaccharide deacetylase [Clostridium folliculivorans]GKU28469.1 polysaccharide deacetylase [Clostridium folliculivorans]